MGFTDLSLTWLCHASAIDATLDPGLMRQLMRSMSSWLRAARWDSSSDVLWWWVCGFAVMVDLWVFLWWFAVDCIGGFALCSGFLIIFFIFYFFILCCFKHCKIFFRLFSGMQQNTGKKLFSLKSFTFVNILQWKIIYSETKGTLNCSKVWRKIDF